MRPLSYIGRIGLIVAAIGAINWGLVSLFDYNLVTSIFGNGTARDVVYVIVGVGGVIALFDFVDMVRAGSLSGGARFASMLASVALLLTAIGAINWGLIGLFDYNVVTAISSSSTFTDVVYTIVGIAGVLVIPLAIGLWAALSSAESKNRLREGDRLAGERDRLGREPRRTSGERLGSERYETATGRDEVEGEVRRDDDTMRPAA